VAGLPRVSVGFNWLSPVCAGLGRWVARQRACFWRNELSAKQVEQLEAIGFDFGRGIAERSGGEDGSDNVQAFPGLAA